jgi:hypothetical protein
MSAVCTIAGCGEVAVGQCRHCDRDFCVAHRFVGPRGAAVLDLCSECVAAEAETRAYSCGLREESLATIRITAKMLIHEGFSPTDVFTWTYRTDSAWWAFGRFGRTEVAVPLRVGWAVGDYPWEGRVDVGRGTSTNEVFVRPTFVDVDGEIAPFKATRASTIDDELFTDEMCAQIAATMAEILTAAREQPELFDQLGSPG